MRRRAYGAEAWIIDQLDDPAAWAEGIRAQRTIGVTDVVPSEAAVVVHCARSLHDTIGDLLDQASPIAAASTPIEPLIVPVRYDGSDLAEVAQHVGISVEDVIVAHSSVTYTVAFCGFSPGFGYLRGLDERLHLPRRATPRTAVPSGAVAIAAGYSAVYPSRSPGGWHLIGSTDLEVWDMTASPPALMLPGRSVRFERVSS